MKDYSSKYYEEISEMFANEESFADYVKNGIELSDFQYFLFRKGIDSYVIDEYPNRITNKESLLEAIFYQARLFDMLDLNWDSLQEGLESKVVLDNYKLVLIFSDINNINGVLNDVETLKDIIADINNDQEWKLNYYLEN